VTVAGTTVKRRPFLVGMKVRIKELAQEAKFIRFEQNKIKSKQKIMPIPTEYDHIKKKWYPERDDHSKDWVELNSHRKCEVREAARAAQLAYGFLREISYSKIENKRKPEKEFRFNYYIKPEIKRLAKKFGKLGYKETYDEEVEKWLTL
jgi:hypothetical protein